MRKVYWEILASVIFVLGGTFLAYGQLAGTAAFWNAQSLWSIALIICSAMIAGGYYYEGWLIHHGRSRANISASAVRNAQASESGKKREKRSSKTCMYSRSSV